MILEYNKGDKLKYIGEKDISFPTDKFNDVVDIIKSKGINIIVIRDVQGGLHKYSEFVVRNNFITISQYRERVINILLN